MSQFFIGLLDVALRLRVETADIQAVLQVCLEKILQLERENETHIKRMAAMQAELDHLRAIVNRTSSAQRRYDGERGAAA